MSVTVCFQTNQLLLFSPCLIHHCWIISVPDKTEVGKLIYWLLDMSTHLLCYLKWASGLEDFCTHILLSQLLVGVISAYNTVVANSLCYRVSWKPQSFPTSLCNHTAQACLADTMPSCGLHYTDDITITATTVYTSTIKELFSGGSCSLYYFLLFVLSNLFILYIRDRHTEFPS